MTTATAKKPEGTSGGYKFTPPDSSKVEFDVERFVNYAALDKEGLKAEAIPLLKQYSKITSLLKHIAELVVAARTKFRSPKPGCKGLPDWDGQSPSYQAFIATWFEEAGIPSKKKDTTGLRNALDYHVQNCWKQMAPPEHLEKMGLSAKKRGAGGAAGSNGQQSGTTPAKQTGVTVNNQPTNQGQVVGAVSQAQSNAAAKKAKATPPDENPVTTLQVVKLEVNNNLKNVAYVTELLKKGISDNEVRFQVVRTADDIAKLAQQLSEAATSLSMRHQGRTPDQIAKDTEKEEEKTEKPAPTKPANDTPKKQAS